VYSVKWCEDLSDKETFDLLTQIRSVVEGIGIRGVKVLKEIDETIERLKEDIAYEEDDEDADEGDEADDDAYSGANEWRIKYKESRENPGAPDPLAFDTEAAYLEAVNDYKYGWRKSVWRYNTDIDPNLFETEKEFAEAVKAAREKERARDRAQKADLKTIYDFCQVIFDLDSRSYFYFTNGLSVEIGDRVVVPFGYQNEEREAIVVSKGACTAAALPCSIDWIKKVIRKI